MTFSVAMCTYNGARFIEAQIASIATQTLLPIEIVVCDDQSTDDTIAILERMARDLPFPIRVHVNPVRLRTVKNFERAISLCEGEFIALADQDDAWVPHKLERLAAAFADRPDVAAIFTDAEVVDDDLKPLGYSMFDAVKLFDDEQRQIRDNRALELFLTRCVATGATMAIRASYRDDFLPIPDTSRFVIHDAWIATLAMVLGRLDFLPDRLILYRQHGGQQLGAPFIEGSPTIGHKLDEIRDRTFDYYGEVLHRFELIQERLDRIGADRAQPADAAHLRGAIEHLRGRIELPRNRLRRVPTVVRELANRRYFSFSNGWLSAAKDLTVARG